MSTTQRKAKEKEELKELILQAAKNLFVEKGVEHTTMRNIADAIQYSVGTIYVYYKDKNAILYDLHSKGFQEFNNVMKVLMAVSDPMERLKALGRTYIKFATEHTDMYDLMFNMKAPIEFLCNAELDIWHQGKSTFNLLRTTVQECKDQGYFQHQDVEPLSFAIWGCVHGMCSLVIRQRVHNIGVSSPETIIEDGLEEFNRLVDRK